jgi:signal transduction histidine kinase
MSSARWFHAGALGALLVIIGASILLWPLPSLGFEANLRTGAVRFVQPESSAAAADLQPGDRVTHIYGYAWDEINSRLWLLPLPWRTGTPTPITLLRDGQKYERVLLAGQPTIGLQIEKALRLLIALVCWVTGYALGTSPRAADQRLRWVAWFWIALAGTLGIYQLTHITSYLLTIGVLWVQCTVLAPLAVAIYFWYPLRPGEPRGRPKTQRVLPGAIGGAQVAVIGLAVVSAAPVVLYERLHLAVPVAFLISAILSAALLWRAYRATQIAHIRRQIRLIGAACVLVACWWALLLLIRWGNTALWMQLPPAVITLGAVLIPLAYLVGGVSADLMRFDQMVRRVLLHTLTLLCAMSLIVMGARGQLIRGTPLIALILLFAMYPTIYRIMQRLIDGSGRNAHPYAALDQARLRMGTSLDATVVLTFLRDGLRDTFRQPPLAIYHRPDRSAPRFVQVLSHAFDGPVQIESVLLTQWPASDAPVLAASSVQQRPDQQPLEHEAAALIFHPHIARWGLIRHQDGALLALVLLGPRGDADPYLPADDAALGQVLNTAALALTNCASYAEQIEAQRMIRELYRHAQQIEERTAVEIANEIHDEVINAHLRTNREALETILPTVCDPQLQARLQAIFNGETAASAILRLICEQMKPSGIDHPLGLRATLRQQTDRIRASWSGDVNLQIEHAVVSTSERVHRALIRITREALTNAVKHAEATTITVLVRFPQTAADPLEISIRDNGCARRRPITPKIGHWGVRNMREYAEAIGAQLTWHYPETGGTWVEITVPAEVLQTPAPEGALHARLHESDSYEEGPPA